jgi:hypothetical protein
MDSTKDGDMTASAKMMMGATHRASGQPIQKTLTDAVQMDYLKSNPQLAQELANKPMLKRTKLPEQMEFVEWIRQTTPKALSEITTIPLTKVEHWFRKDAKGFSHPSIEDWNTIKYYLENWQQWDYQLTYEESIQWKGMLPTPKTMFLKTPCSADAYTENLSKKEQKFGNSGTLAQEVKSGFIYKRGMLPTPTATDYKGAYPPTSINNNEARKSMLRNVYQHTEMEYHSKSSQLNPRFVAEMMGFPPNWTELPFQSGEQNQSKDMETP